ncbi:GSU3473 family protein [Pelotalea chapellei]|uniref:Uncharacterized protein n=1 Tax=Pelotalea chapellei TaxID=44671 RepID=A0ABS5UAV8_9BACT|nr:hypothetical protein [Pelotalea chapellei]MBT1072795.1 hypothetical protein [Pelotalea chapellei]
MLIHVKYTDNRYDYVKDNMLDSMIESGMVARFRRNSGWVTVGTDPVRKGKREFNALWSDDLRELVA